MKILVTSVLCLSLLPAGAGAGPGTAEGGAALERFGDLVHTVGPGQGFLVVPETTRDCPDAVLVMNADGDYENGYCLRGGAVEPPDWSAFAECYEGPYEVCAVVVDLTREPYGEPPEDALLNAFVWDDNGGEPGLVLCLVTGYRPHPIAPWPEVSRHEVELPSVCCVEGAWWVGYWPDWPGYPPCYWYVAADVYNYGEGGCPSVKLNETMVEEPGWYDVSVAFGATDALGLGARVRSCPPTAGRTTSWGRVKSLYR